MLGLDSLKQFYFLPELHDMRCGANRILETVWIKGVSLSMMHCAMQSRI